MKASANIYVRFTFASYRFTEFIISKKYCLYFIQNINNILYRNVLFQVKLWYDARSLQLVVTIVEAAGLPPEPHNRKRNPYVKMFLLPDRRYVLIIALKWDIYMYIFFSTPYSIL